MKTQFSRRASVVTPARALIALGVVILLLIALLVRFAFPGTISSLAKPLWSAGEAATELVPIDGAHPSIATLEEENAALANENELLRARLRDVGAERSLPQDSGTLAGVLARPPLSPYDTLVLDQGSEDGITEGSLVYAQGVPIGTIAEAGSATSRALLFSAPERITEGWIGENRLPVTLIGAGSGVFEADVPRETPVAEGDLVYIPGPGALPVGKVERVASQPSSPRAQLRIRPLVNPFALTWVRILP